MTVRPASPPVVVAVVVLAVTFALALWASASGASEPRAGRLIVADLRGHELLVVDPHDLDVTQRIPLPGGPHELLELPDGRIAVSIEQAGLLAIVDLDDGSVEVVPVGGIPHGLALHDDTILVTDRARDAVRRLRLFEWVEVESISTGTWPHAVGVTPDGRIAVATASAGRLEIGDRHEEVGNTTETLDVRHDGVIAAAAATDGVVVLHASASGARLQTWQVGGRPVRVLFSPDGRTLAVALSATGAVGILDDAGLQTVSVAGVPDGLVFSPGGDRLYVSDVFGGAITVIDVLRGEAIATEAVGVATGALVWLDGAQTR